MTIARQKLIQIGNAYLVRQELRYYDPATDSFLPWTGPATVRFATASIDSGSGAVTYTTIPGMGPYALVSALPGIFSFGVSSTVVEQLNVAAYLNTVVYQVVEGGAEAELADVVPLLVKPQRYAT